MPNRREITLQVERVANEFSRDNFERIREFINEQIIPDLINSVWNIVTVDESTIARQLDEIHADTSGNDFSVLLPSDPVVGFRCRVVDSESSFATNNMTVDGNGVNIEGSSTLTLSTNNDSREIVYNGNQYVTLRL